MNNLLNVAGTIFLIIITINIIAFIVFYIKRKTSIRPDTLSTSMWKMESDQLKQMALLSKTFQPLAFDYNALENAIKIYVNVFNVSVAMCSKVNKNVQSNLRVSDYLVADKGEAVKICLSPNTTDVEPIVIILNKSDSGNFTSLINAYVSSIEESARKYTGKL